MPSKPSIPKGTRDFLPDEMAKRNYIFDTIKKVYALYGFKQIETPAMENLSTLMGKYGEEGDKLLFKILNSGNFLDNVDEDDLKTKNSVKVISKISEKGLRYDLTVPFARFVVQYRDQIKFPFRRFQIQPVWRADRPQKGRYREFYQCDADIVGSDSLLNELELLQIIDEVFAQFGINVCIKLNNRKVLAGISEVIGAPEKIIDITVAIDKLDKVGLDNVNAELAVKGLSADSVNKLQPILALKGDNVSKINDLRKILSVSEIGTKGVEELETIFNMLNESSVRCEIELDLTLARGLNYYTGTIIEVKSKDVQIGSITGGGRYDNLTGVFGMDGVSGVGISFGADRIYDVLNQLDLYPKSETASTQVIFLNFGAKEALYSLKCMKTLRTAGISCEIYPDSVKFKKQMGYADECRIPYVAIIGETEMADNLISLKNMKSGEQEKLSIEALIAKLV
ncbi:MAG: histidine--tRNA ligase [Paludibacteraceae bacterium]|nr:histidine--tRNA ligase [Paludibacteraceae bacterium]